MKGAGRQFVLSCLGVVALVLGAGVWRYRVELFLAPAAWRQLQGARESADLEAAARRFIALRRSDFSGGEKFQLQELRMREGGTAHVLSWKPPEGQTGGSHLLLDARGRVIESELELYQWHTLDSPASTGFDILRAGDRGCWVSADVYEISVDARGWVPESRVQPTEPSPFDPERLSELLASPHIGDHLRALYLIERALCQSTPEAWGLTRHGDSHVRARAAEVLGRDGSARQVIMSLLADPDAEVRLSALRVARNGRDWEDRVQALAGDSDRFIRLEARHYLLESSDPNIARSSYLELIHERELTDYMIPRDPELPASYVTPEAAEELVAWLEEAPPDPDGWPLWAELHRCEAHLRPLVSRLVSVYWRLEESDAPREDLAATLVRLADPQADAALAEILSRPFDETLIINMHSSVLVALLDRAQGSLDIRLSNVIEEMGDLVRLPQKVSCGEEPRFLAALLLVKWGVRDAAGCLLARCEDPDNHWLRRWIWGRREILEKLPELEVAGQE